MTHTTISISPADIQAGERLDPIYLEIDGLKFELMNFNDPRFPLDLIPAALIIKGSSTLSDEQAIQAIAIFTDYFRTQHPQVWSTIRNQDEPIRWLTGLIQTWAEQSALDPKA